MHFRILEMIATSGFLADLECTIFVFGRELTALPHGPFNWFKGNPTSKGKGRRGDGRGTPPDANSWIRPWLSPY